MELIELDRQIDLEALVSFDAIALHGGIGAASRSTGRPKATLSRHLGDLEQQLGVRLIERGDRRVRLTEEGRRLHERAHGLLVELGDIARTVSGGAEEPRGHLRISAPVVLAHVALMPVVTRYCQLYPHVAVDVVAEDRRADPVEDGYDLVLRVDPRPEERLIGRRVLTDRRVVVSAPSLPMPDDDEIVTPGLMMATSSSTTWSIRDGTDRPRTIIAKLQLRLSSPMMVRDAALAGLGAALLPQLLVASDLAAGRLVCWGVMTTPEVEIWALHPSRRLLSSKVRAFLTLLADLAGTRHDQR